MWALQGLVFSTDELNLCGVDVILCWEERLLYMFDGFVHRFECNLRIVFYIFLMNTTDRLLHPNVLFLEHFVIWATTNTSSFEAQGEKLTDQLASKELELQPIISREQKKTKKMATVSSLQIERLQY